MKVQECPICGKMFNVAGSSKRRYCSRACMSEGYRTQLRGENNPNYRHGEKSCHKCGGPVSRHAKGDFCQKCRGSTICGEDNPFFGKLHSAETRERMAKNHADVTGDKNPQFGKKLSEEHKDNLSRQRTEFWKTATTEVKERCLSALRRGLESQLSQNGGTVPENKVAESLQELNFGFERNKLLYDKFFVDFLLEDGTVIEVFGDYWHGNPEVFPELNAHQKRQVKKDKARLAYLRECGRRVIVVWEKEIQDNFGLVKERIQNECQTT